MHKFFAKPLFLGKKVVFLTQCHSTNDELASWVKKEHIPEGALVHTNHQLSGKGQRGNTWVDQPCKSLLFSILLKPIFLPIKSQHLLNLITGLAVLETVKEEVNGDLKLKWPNDIYLNEKKVGGVLIENNIKAGKIESSIVGIGLNLNQEVIEVQNATSLYLESGTRFDRIDFLERILMSLESWYLKLKDYRYSEIENIYLKYLLWKGELHMFQDKDSRFLGKIKGINETGKLIVERDNIDQTYDIKEIQFIY